MRPLWHPISTILLDNPRCYASPAVLRMMLSAGADVPLIYAGDRMWPSVDHGSRFLGRALTDARALMPGTAVLACPEGIPDLQRLVRREGPMLRLATDADPETITVPDDALLGEVLLPPRRPSAGLARVRRLMLDLREARFEGPDPRRDPADTVLQKYDSQSSHYAEVEGADLEQGLRERIGRCLPPRGKVLVIGSGSGRECFGLARDGFSVSGIDFSPSMVEAARREADHRGLDIEFLAADIRHYGATERSLAGLLFTYDVYSFIPHASDRIELLSRIRSWLRPDGRVLLSARRLHRVYERLLLGLQHVARSGRRNSEWGDSHTRWIAANGTMHRSFVHVFSRRRLGNEIRDAGFRLEGWQAGHGILAPDSDGRPA